jgi:carboxypeptidase T
MPRYRITLSGLDDAGMLDLARKPGIEIFEEGIRFSPDTGYSLSALAGPDEIRKLQQDGYALVQHEDADQLGKLRQREVGRGKGHTTAAATGYLTVEEVEAAILQAAAPPYSAIAELITLPEKTWHRRQCHALKIGSGSGANRPGVYFLGGVHAREWGSSDILVHFIEQIEQAYLTNTTLTFRGKTFSAAEIKAVVDTLDIVIFPQANPDGRHYSMTVDPYWRKNLPPTPDLQQRAGVDLNRNFDFLWEFTKYLSRKSLTYTSTDPSSSFYYGERAFSEPETRNARWIADTFTNTRFFIDVHSWGSDILYAWGDSESQTKDAEMNFMNGHYDGCRGVKHGLYKEYIPGPDLQASQSFASALREGIAAVRGRDYLPKPAFNLYATSGSSSDYFYSRHFRPGGGPKILSFTLEWGTEPQPPYQEMRQIIDEVTAGLLAFCLKIVATIRTQGLV